MIKKRNIALCIVLSLITCGIYGIYWAVCIVNDVNTVTMRDGQSGGIVVLLGIITFGIYFVYWFYKAGEAMDNLRSQQGKDTGNLGLLYLILTIVGFGIVAYALLQSELNKYAAE